MQTSVTEPMVLIHIFPELRGTNSNLLAVRQELRRRMAKICFPAQEPPSEILDLSNQRPLKWASISHTNEGSGIAFTESDRAIGFDLEVAGRVSRPVFERIATDREVKSLPNSDYTAGWTAKEACFKALSHKSDLKTITDFEVVFDSRLRSVGFHVSPEWSPVFRFESHPKAAASSLPRAPTPLGAGIVTYSNQMVFAVFLQRSTVLHG